MNRMTTGLRTAVALVMVLAAGRASAQLVTDQFFDAFNAPSPSNDLGGPVIADFQVPAQVFTAGVGGLLTEVGVQVQQSEAPRVPTRELVLSILPLTLDGAPDFGNSLGTVSLPPGAIPAFNNFSSGPFTAFDVSGLGITVAPGDRLALELTYPAGDGSYFIFDSELDGYAGGASYTFGPFDGFVNEFNRDLGFRTSVLVPEPSSLTLLGLGGPLVARRRRRR